MENITEKKQDGFKNEKMIVLPTETLSGYKDHPIIKRMFLTDVGYFPCAAHHYKEREIGIEEYILIYCTEGNGIIWIGDLQYILHKNEAICIPRFLAHRYYADKEEPWSILWLHFKGEDTQYFPVDECKVLQFQEEDSITVRSLYELLFSALNENYTLNNYIYISQIVSLILGQIYSREKDSLHKEQNDQITEVVRYMYKHLYDNLTLEEIAKEFELSKSYLNVIFKKYTKHAPMDFYIQLKMKEACKLLRSSHAYVYEVAQRLGYQDQYYFSRVFKKTVGVSPQKFKQRTMLYYKE